MAKDGKKSLTCSELLNVSDNKRKPMWRVQIPEQLQDDVFILLRPRDKIPKEMWGFPENQYDFETMSRKLNVSIEGYPEYNYGVLCGKHLIIDADNAEKLFSGECCIKLCNMLKTINMEIAKRCFFCKLLFFLCFFCNFPGIFRLRDLKKG